MDNDGSGLLERSQLIQGLSNFGIEVDDGPGGDIEKIMGFFDRDVVGRIIIGEFHRGLRVRYRQRWEAIQMPASRSLGEVLGRTTHKKQGRSCLPYPVSQARGMCHG